MIDLLPAFAAGWLLTLALLIIEHLLWRDTSRIVRYMLGAGTICTGCTMAGAVLDDPVLAFGPWVVASAGLIVVLMTWQEQRAGRAKQTAQKRGEVVDIAKGLTQEIIDGSGERSHHHN